MCFFFFFKQKTAYEIKECDWSSDVCSSDLVVTNAIGAIDPTNVFPSTRTRLLSNRAPCGLKNASPVDPPTFTARCPACWNVHPRIAISLDPP